MLKSLSSTQHHTALKQSLPIIPLDTRESSSLLVDVMPLSWWPILARGRNHSTMQHESAIVKAPKHAELCSACYEMLNPREKQKSLGGKVRKQSFEKFREAAAQKCAICSFIWNLTDEHPLAWSQFPIDTWKPMRYDIYAATHRLMLNYFDPVQGKRMFLTLKFIGPEGNMPQTLHVTSFLRRFTC
jgi:hypothetical protein